jgi:hypothetical protein
MPNTSREAKVRSQIQAILGGVSGLMAPRIVLGLKDEDPSDEFFQDIHINGYFVLIEPAEQQSFSVQEGIGTFDVDVKFFFPIPNKADFTFLNEEDVAYIGIRNALATFNNWTNCPTPHSISISKPEMILDTDSPAGKFLFKLSFIAD